MGFKPKTPGPRAPPASPPPSDALRHWEGQGQGTIFFLCVSLPASPSLLPRDILFMLLPALSLFSSLCFSASISASQFLSPRFKNLPKLTRECLFQKIPSSQGKVLLAQPGSRSCPWFHLRVQQGCWACTPPPWVREAMLGGGGLSKHPEGVYSLLTRYPASGTTGTLGQEEE